MYEVFIENISVFIGNFKHSSIKNIDFSADQLENINPILNFIEYLPTKTNVNIHSENPENDFHRLFKAYNKMEAAGGLVHRKNLFLFILKNNMWDLPKGLVDPGEEILTAAKREILEECNIQNLTGNLLITKTYHTYSYHGTPTLKITHWFAFDYNGEYNGNPQVEEGIMSLEWNNIDQMLKRSNMYPSIQKVLLSYLKMKKV